MAERVIGEGLRTEDVDVGRADIVVTAQNEHLLAGQQCLGALVQPVHPGDLVGELVGVDGIAIGQVEAANGQRTLRRLDLAFDVACRLVGLGVGQAAGGDLDGMQREQGDAVEALLADHLDLVAGGFDLQARKLRLLGF